MDRHGRHIAVRRAWLQPRGHPDRPGEEPQFPRRESVGPSRIQGSRRQRRTRHPQHQEFARTGAPDELDLDTTIKETANHGYLDVHMRPERRNAVKVLVFFDIGGSMDSHIEQVEELFSAAKTEFKHMEYFYFHNCLYEGVWKQNRRRFTDRTPTWDVLHQYPHDYKVVFVGDASMSQYEILVPGGSVEHVNEEAGSVWLDRITRTYPHAVWLNPVAQRHWDYSESTTIIRRLFSERMFPITIEGLEGAMKELVR